MAKHKPRNGSPRAVLSIAAFCTRVLDGSDGCFSAIRLLDHLFVKMPLSYKPGDRIDISFWALIGFRSRKFKAGELTGRHTMRLVMRNPKGKSKPGQEITVDLPENATAFNFRVKMNWNIKTEGLWWLNVFLDDKFYTKMPLRIVFLPSAGEKELEYPGPANSLQIHED